MLVHDRARPGRHDDPDADDGADADGRRDGRHASSCTSCARTATACSSTSRRRRSTSTRRRRPAAADQLPGRHARLHARPADRGAEPEQLEPGAAVHRQHRGDEARQRPSRSTSRARIASARSPTSTRARSPAPRRLATRTNGIDYYGVETLNIALGIGNDVFNVQGTSAVTNLTLGAGDERVYVSLAGERRPRRPIRTSCAGDLDADRRRAQHRRRHRPPPADDQRRGERRTATRSASPTRRPTTLNGLSPTAEIWITGLGEPGGISYKAARDRQRSPTASRTGRAPAPTRSRSTARTSAPASAPSRRLNTGLGNDDVTVDLDTGEDDFFVLDTQGQAQHLLPIAGGLSARRRLDAPPHVVDRHRRRPAGARSANLALGTVELLAEPAGRDARDRHDPRTR